MQDKNNTQKLQVYTKINLDDSDVRLRYTHYNIIPPVSSSMWFLTKLISCTTKPLKVMAYVITVTQNLMSSIREIRM
jgi:hypothetical protein